MEPDLFSRLRSRGLTYSRYIDDVTVSSHRTSSAKSKTYAASQVIGMFARKGFKAKRSKLNISDASKRMIVHNLTINRHTSVGKFKKSNLRSAVRHIELRFGGEMKHEEYRKDWNVVASRVGHVKHLHRQLYEALRCRLEEVRPRFKDA